MTTLAGIGTNISPLIPPFTKGGNKGGLVSAKLKDGFVVINASRMITVVNKKYLVKNLREWVML